ncbi:VOC family protein [uncultured Robinsoniella sp.]|uniref:VOC family protein n=1 Tax=uncultured Robinsoniella sp. TaxID=904190 RepID=UPI00374E6A6A
MKYGGTLIAVQNMEKSRYFYETVMEQKVTMDLGAHVSFEGGLSLQNNYEELVGAELIPLCKENNFQLYFETDDLDKWYEKIKMLPEIEFLHGIKEYPWGQRVMRFYDYEQHIVEAAESMESVVKRCLSLGWQVDQIAKKTMLPEAFISQFL